MASKTDRWFVTERAESLAVVWLTRRDDVAVQRQPAAFAFDILATLRGKRAEPRPLGIEVRGRAGLPPKNLSDAEEAFGDRSADLLHLKGSPVPVCLFCIFTECSQGFWRWIVEPVIDPRGKTELVYHELGHYVPIDDGQLEKIFQHVDRWYDAMQKRKKGA